MHPSEYPFYHNPMNKNESQFLNTRKQIAILDNPTRQDPKPESDRDLDWCYLLVELKRIDLLIQRQVSLWQMAGQDPQDDLRGLYLTDQGINSLIHRPFASHWGHLADSQQMDHEYRMLAEQFQQRRQQILNKAEQQKIQLRLPHLVRSFQLDDFEVDTLLVCLAPVLDLRYEKIYAYLQDDVTRKRPSIHLILDLLCPPGRARFQSWRYFYQESPLFKHHLLNITAETFNAPLLNQVIYPDNRIAAWLLGHNQYQSDTLSLFSTENITHQTETQLPYLDNEIDLAAIDLHSLPVLIFFGADHQRQDVYAHQVAKIQNQSLLKLNLDRVLQDGVSIFLALRWALRDAILLNAIVYITNWELVLNTDRSPSAQLMQEICKHPGVVIIAGEHRWVAKGFTRHRNLLWFETRLPVYPVRLELWNHFLKDKPVQEPVNWMALAGQFQLSTEQIHDACASAWDSANQRSSAISNEDLFAAARAHSNPNLSTLARKITPRYSWQDLVIPLDQLQILREIVATVLGRPMVLDDWGLAKKLAPSRGVTVLFAGPPGTGKTMAAEVISRELGLDLYKIDLSTVISKYIGETEKNLEQIFIEAETSNAILFFDEADALFGKRSEVRDSHDRYANIEISYLLQRMEAYDGVTILATNLRANLDEAFKRRLQFAVDFPFPEEDDRLRIWQALFPHNAPCENEIDLELMARRFRLAGGNIRNILVSAAYLAAADGGRLGMAHLLHAAKRELQKMGRLVDEPGLFSVEHMRSS